MSYTSYSDQILLSMRQGIIKALDNASGVGRDTAAAGTPVDTGYAQASVHNVVLDEGGQRVAGQDTDGNGNAVPTYPASGMLSAYVGSNTAPRDGRGYYLGLEVGAFSAQGSAMLARGHDAMNAELPGEIGRQVHP